MTSAREVELWAARLRTIGIGAVALDTNAIRDIAPDVLGPDGRLKILPAAYWAATTWQERAAFGTLHGIYSFPTVELVEYLRGVIGDRSAIEIGAGNGVLAEALGIPATDSFQQRIPKYREYYERLGQVIVPYGPNVIEMHASRAVRRLKPDVVIGCWVTHKFDPRYPAASGNEVGVDESDVLDHCRSYVFVGNERIHAAKPLWRFPHERFQFPFVFSRAHVDSADFVAVWRGRKK